MPLFRGGNKDTIERIMHDFPSRYVHYKKGDTIAMQGNACRSLYILCEGSVYAKMISEEGKEFTLDTLSAPDVLASAFVFSSEGIFPVTILANSDCDLWIVSKESLLRIIEDGHIGSQYVPEQAAERICLADTLVANHELYRTKREHTELAGGRLYSWSRSPVPFTGCSATGRSRCVEKGEQRICTCLSECNCRKRSPIAEPLLRLYSIDRLQIFQLFSCRVVIQQYFDGLCRWAFF